MFQVFLAKTYLSWKVFYSEKSKKKNYFLDGKFQMLSFDKIRFRFIVWVHKLMYYRIFFSSYLYFLRLFGENWQEGVIFDMLIIPLRGISGESWQLLTVNNFYIPLNLLFPRLSGERMTAPLYLFYNLFMTYFIFFHIIIPRSCDRCILAVPHRVNERWITFLRDRIFLIRVKYIVIFTSTCLFNLSNFLLRGFSVLFYHFVFNL